MRKVVILQNELGQCKQSSKVSRGMHNKIDFYSD